MSSTSPNPPIYEQQQPQMQPSYTQQPAYGCQPPLQQQNTYPAAVQMGPVPVQAPGIMFVQQGGPQYQMATPLAALNQGPAPVDCPSCGQRAMTAVTYEAGGTTHAWAAILCFCFCVGCIPYLVTSLKDVGHRCSKCGVLLATWHRSGHTQVHIAG